MAVVTAVAAVASLALQQVQTRKTEKKVEKAQKQALSQQRRLSAERKRRESDIRFQQSLRLARLRGTEGAGRGGTILAGGGTASGATPTTTKSLIGL